MNWPPPAARGKPALVASLALLLSSFATVAAFHGEDHGDAIIRELAANSNLHQEKPNKSGATKEYYGVNSCKKCHTNGFDEKDTFICRGTEFPIWEKQDKHALAYKVLGEKRAKDMAMILGGNAQEREDCLACHGVLVPKKPDITKNESYRLEEGVSCVACHGPDLTDPGDNAMLGWVLLHGPDNKALRDRWRARSRPEKEAKFGMTDLWSPAKRTEICASCHVGNVELGRVVTHEMYAAGHPPLPSFEVVTFSNHMPRHWQYLREKDKKVLDLVMKFRPSEVDLEQTHLLAIGGLLTFRENLQLLAGKAATKDWPELANYSCYACHHELKSKSWRQERGYAGKPGRPPMREWPTALVELGLSYAASDAEEAKQLGAELQTRLAALQVIFDSHPFGQPEAVKHKAEDLMRWIEVQVKRIQHRIALDESEGGYGLDATALLLGRWLELEKRSQPDAKVDAGPRRPVPDFDSARQLTWAYQVLYLETASKHEPKLREKLAKAMSAHTAWKGLDDYLRLTLPPGQTMLEPSYALALDRIGQYEPRVYFQQLDAVLKRFPPHP
jgi:hypothetical protein